MKLTKKLETEILTLYHAYWDAYFRGDMKTMASFLDDKCTVYGTAIGEVFTTKNQAVKFYAATADQMTGITDFRKRRISLKAVGDTIMTNEQADLYVLIEGTWTFYGHARITAIFEKKSNEWKLVHQHGSFPDNRTEEGDQIATDTIKEENLQLRDAVKRRTIELEEKNQELEIETSLERVRTVAMGMKKPDDLLTICEVLFNELYKIGFKKMRCSLIHIFKDEQNYFDDYDYSDFTGGKISTIPFKGNTVVEDFLKRIRKTKDSFAEVVVRGKALKDFLDFRKKSGQIEDKRLLKATEINYYFYSVGIGNIGISNFGKISNEQLLLLKRFRNVFHLAYQRYTDISLAETQAREAQIELALERVRARTMAMQKSEELHETSQILFQQMKELEEPVEQLTIGIVKETENVVEIFATIQGIQLKESFRHSIDEMVMNKIYRGWKAKRKSLLVEMNGEEIQVYNRYRNELVKSEMFSTTLSKDDRRIIYAAYFSKGMLALGSNTTLSEESHRLLERFAGVFDGIYTRFLDLQKAEAQAREAQIQLALERVRARTMAMQHSDELGEASALLFKQVSDLGIQTWTSGFNIWEKGDTSFIGYNPTPIGGIAGSYHIPSTEDRFFINIYEAKKREEGFFVFESAGESLAETYRYMKTLPIIKDVLKGIEDSGFPMPTFQINHCAFFSRGFLLFITLEHYPEAHDIFKRFAKVFDQTYTRFLDLQKAEAQAREAQIEVSLERVRSRAMAMHDSADLNSVVATVFEELGKLNLGVLRCGVGIFNKEKETGDVWSTSLSSQGTVLQVSGDESFTIHPLLQGTFNAWLEQKEFYYELEGKDFNDYYKVLSKTNFQLSGQQSTTRQKKNLKQYYYTPMFQAGNLYAFSESPFSEDAKIIMKRFAGVLNLTYNRFLDLQKAEAQAREAQIELSLERVRSRAMAMHKTDELLDAGELIYKELTGLGITSMNVSYAFVNEENKNALYYGINPVDGKIPPVPFIFPHTQTEVMRSVLKSWKKQEAFKMIELDKDATLKHQTWVGGHINSVFEKNNIPFSVEEFLAVSPQTAVIYTFHFTQGYIFIIGKEHLSAMQEEMVLRFTKVFEMTYRRFLDLQKAEAQAREAQIELGLERVRARAMAMQKSEELSELVDTVFKELTKLDFALNWCIINIIDEPTLTNMVWAANPETNKQPESYLMKFEDYPFHNDMMKGYQERKPKHVYIIEGKEKKEYDDYLFSKTEWRRVPKKAQAASRAMKRYVASFTFSNFGGLQTVGEEPLSNENLDILSRFGKVFDLTYTRFNDLKNAEAQAREAKIEAALETVRASSMAMHHSEELEKVVKTLSDKLIDLGLSLDGAFIFFFEKEKRSFHLWIATNHLPTPIKVEIPYKKDIQNNLIVKNLWEAIETGRDFINESYSGKVKDDYFGFVSKYNELKIPEAVRKFQLEAECWTVSLSAGKNSVVGIDSWSGKIVTQQDFQVLKRFAKVFEQAYTRFLDLKKAEAQAREAQIEAALERTRTQSMIMQHSNELDDTLRVFHEQVLLLGINSEFSYLWLPDEEKDSHLFWATWAEDLAPGQAGKNGSTVFKSKALNYPLDRNEPATAKCLGDWKSDEPIHSYALLPGEVENYFVAWKELLDGVEKLKAEHFPDGLYYVEAFMKYGCFGIMIEKELTEVDKKILGRFAIEFERAYTRFLDLQKAEAQAREAKIEMALEKVRSRTMAMQKGEELQDVVVLLYKELIVLGVTNFVTCGYVEINEQTGRQLTWVTGPGGDSLGLFYLPLTGDATFDERYAAWKEQQVVFHQTVAGEKRSKHLEYAITTFNSKEAEQMVLSQFPDPTVFYCFNFSHGYLHLVGGSLLNKEEEALLARFTRVFEQTYARFLDLKKAEAQAREARIEMALEKIRSRTMAMQHSDELPEAANLLFLEVQALGIPAWSAGYNILSNDTKSSTCIMSSEGQIQSAFQLPFTNSGEPSFAEWLEAIETKQAFFVQELSGKAIDDHYNYMKSLPQVGQVLKELEDAGLSLPTYQINHLSFFNGGFLLFITYEPVPHAHDIFQRFTKVFEQTYTRFLDLKKAEARARESQIEASLEKVRSRTMGMQKSDELGDVATVLFKELNQLVDNLWTCGFVLCEKDREEDEWWLSDDNGFIPAFSLPNVGDVTHANIYNAWKNGATYHTEQLEGKALQDHYDWLMNLPVARKIFDEMLAAGFKLPSWQKLHCAYFKTGYLVIITQVPCPEEQIFKRFAQVFDLTYTRFLDLKKAEAQTREAKIETALERVRARALAMQEPEELKAVAEVLRHEMGILGVEELETCSIYINDVSAEKAECWYALKDIRSTEKKLVNDHFALDLSDTWVGREMLQFYNLPEKQTSIVMQGHNRKEWINYCEEKSVPFRGYYGEVIPDRTYHLYKFSHGAIGAAAVADISDESWNLLKRAASVFSLAYSRFKDLTQARTDLIKLKEEKKRVEDALTNLQAAQKQLIQSEKMASLGELTAGIAHEIQNPLNFVNNFSEVSKELLDEIKVEMEKGNLDDAKEIMNDVIQNLEKINHHGKRADGIVKGMLQHSRISSGVKEPTDINALCDEYLRLSYHGSRAKDKSFNATLKTDFDERIGNIHIIPQDIGRAVLNLLTNAFYSVNEKSLLAVAAPTVDKYAPTVSISTKKINNNVEITVTDNGNGIPQKIMDKIFQPFFTTKPTGQGTGLGLSLSYDIVKSHGGELEVNTKEKEGTTFIISLPVNII